MDVSDLHIRRLSPGDSLDELTELLHGAYEALARAGMRYVASHQTVEITRRRVEGGECYVAIASGRIVGTIKLELPGTGHGPSLYAEPDVVKLQQFGVLPTWQRQGIGSRLVGHVEQRARALGAHRIALDTSEHAHELIAWYEDRGYRRAGRYDWRPHTNYESVLLCRTL